MRVDKKSLMVIIAILSVSILLIWASLKAVKVLAADEEEKQPIKPPSRVLTRNGESIVTLDKSTLIKSGIVVESLKPVSYQRKLKAYGTVTELQSLIDLNNAYASALARVKKTEAVLNASRKEYERLKALYEDNRNISAKAIQATEATLLSNEADALSAQNALHAVEASVGQRWGSVLARWLFDSSHPLKRLMQQKDVLIQITLPAGIHLGSAPQNALVQTADGKVVSAKLVSPSPRTDPRIQGMSFFYITSARLSGLLPGMNVIAYLQVGPKTQGVLIPDSAVVWWQGRAWVYVQKEPGQFVRREVTTETPVKDGWFISKNLNAGDNVVIRGAQLLMSEESTP